MLTQDAATLDRVHNTITNRAADLLRPLPNRTVLTSCMVNASTIRYGDFRVSAAAATSQQQNPRSLPICRCLCSTIPMVSSHYSAGDATCSAFLAPFLLMTPELLTRLCSTGVRKEAVESDAGDQGAEARAQHLHWRDWRLTHPCRQGISSRLELNRPNSNYVPLSYVHLGSDSIRLCCGLAPEFIDLPLAI